MAEENGKYQGIEETLFKILQTDSAKEMGQESFLILLSLVNLMGLVNLVSIRAGVKAPVDAKQAGLFGAGAGGGGGVPGADPPAVQDSRAVPFDQAVALQTLVKKFIPPGQGQNRKDEDAAPKADELRIEK